jgi:hypothetical protein
MANHALSSAIVMERSVLATNYRIGTALSAVPVCITREERRSQSADHAFPKAHCQTQWTSALRLMPQS